MILVKQDFINNTQLDEISVRGLNLLFPNIGQNIKTPMSNLKIILRQTGVLIRILLDINSLKSEESNNK
jgi:hypothetical protein